MDFSKYLAVLVVLCLEGGETGGHGGKHHDHVKLHIPEFIHHGRHTKVITIHHHHHKPKKEHHHHHHHHQKPQIPHGHHYHHHHKKAHKTTHTVSKGHQGHHGHHGHHKQHGHNHGHTSHHGNHGHSHGHHHDAPSINYEPPSVPSFEHDFGSSYSPSAPSYGGSIHQTPQVRGITHTVKQVKVYDSLPGVLPGNPGSHGYEVTEEGEDNDDDVFTSVNSLQQTYPATYGYLRGAAPQPASHDPFAELTPHNIQGNTHDPFAAIAQPTATFSGGESFTGTTQNDPFTSVAPAENIGLLNVQQSPEHAVSFHGDLGEGQAISFAGIEGEAGAFSADGGSISDEAPVSFTREAGIQHASNTGEVETIEY